ncbi:hypothetical protein Q5752_000104 [Cryptotrichosporon argae]
MDEPAPLRVPSILQNPANRTQRQADAHAAQQREHAAAIKRREARPVAPTTGGRGKRVLRRYENASFINNPHVSAPSKSDLYPSVPLHPRPLRASFPPALLPLSAAPSSLPSEFRDVSFPDPSSSSAGHFSTSLKGVRQLLRRKGRRAEVVVRLVEGEIRRWLAGQWGVGWRAVDDETVAFEPAEGEVEGVVLPPLPGDTNAAIPAILSLAATPDSLALALADPFDRLVTHLLARYYRLLSRSHVAATTAGDKVRLTVLEVPHVRVRDLPAIPHAAIVPAPAAPGRLGHDAPTVDAAQGYSLDLVPDLAALSLTRTLSSTSAHTVASERSDASDLTVVSTVSGVSAASELSSVSDFSVLTASSYGPDDYTHPAAPPVYRQSDPDAPPAWSIEEHVEWSVVGLEGESAHSWVLAGADGWEERPSFFDYLFG